MRIAEIEKRLRTDLRSVADFAAIHTMPQTSADVPDSQEVRLVVLGPEHPYSKDAGNKASAAASALARPTSGVSRATQIGLGARMRRALSRDHSAAQIDHFGCRQVLDCRSARLEKSEFLGGLAALHATATKIEEIAFNLAHGEKALGFGLEQVAGLGNSPFARIDEDA